MPPKRLIRDYWPAVLHRARKDTTDFFGLSRKSLTVLATIPIGFGVGALILGPQAMLEEFLSLVSFTFAPIGILAFAIYLRKEPNPVLRTVQV